MDGWMDGLTGSVYSKRLFFWGGGDFPPPSNYNFPQMAVKLCALNLFFGRDNELQIYHGNFLLMDTKHRKLFVIKQSKGCKFMPKVYQNTLGGRAPLGELMRSSRLPSRNGGLLLGA